MIDLEYPNRMTTEEREAHLKMWEAAKPKGLPKIGQMLIFGTSDVDQCKGKDLENLFYSPEGLTKEELEYVKNPYGRKKD